MTEERAADYDETWEAREEPGSEYYWRLMVEADLVRLQAEATAS